jgi:hypothetical protein
VVGVVIWVVVGVAALLLLIAIVRRLWQRVSGRSDRPGAAAHG